MTRVRLLQSLILLAAIAGSLVWVTAASASSSGRCDVYASPSGSDQSSGRLASPKASLAGLDRALAPGQTGCLLAGTYGTIHTSAQLERSGTAAAQITIRSAPGQHTTIVGLIELQGSYTTLTNLTIDGSNDLYDTERAGTSCPYPVSNGLEINGHDDIFEHNDYYQSIARLRGNGIGIGWNGQADNTIIRYNRIHDVGRCRAEDQLIYLSHGDHVQIYDNWLWNDPHGWGVQLYPDAVDAHVYSNIVDHAGSGFVIAGASTGNMIDHNIVMNSVGLSAAGLTGVAISSPGAASPGNRFVENLSFRNRQGIADTDGVILSDNTTRKPSLVDPIAHDYRPINTRILANWNLWNGGSQVAHIARAPRHAR